MTEPLMDRLLPIALVGTERSPGLRALLREVPVRTAGSVGEGTLRSRALK